VNHDYSYLESQRLILADDALRDELSRLKESPDVGSPSLLAQTLSLGSYPTSAMAFFAVTPMGLLGTEAEGSTGVTASAGGTFFALNLGPAIPPVGTQVLVTFVGNRWVFSYGA
jgi:hypothetical protein